MLSGAQAHIKRADRRPCQRRTMCSSISAVPHWIQSPQMSRPVVCVSHYVAALAVRSWVTSVTQHKRCVANLARRRGKRQSHFNQGYWAGVCLGRQRRGLWKTGLIRHVKGKLGSCQSWYADLLPLSFPSWHHRLDIIRTQMAIFFPFSYKDRYSSMPTNKGKTILTMNQSLALSFFLLGSLSGLRVDRFFFKVERRIGKTRGVRRRFRLLESTRSVFRIKCAKCFRLF